MYNNENVPLGADNESAPWNLKTISIGISMQVSRSSEINVPQNVDLDDINLYEIFENSHECEHLKKLIRAAGLTIDNIEVYYEH